jgi:hypothetical protein
MNRTMRRNRKITAKKDLLHKLRHQPGPRWISFDGEKVVSTCFCDERCQIFNPFRKCRKFNPLIPVWFWRLMIWAREQMIENGIPPRTLGRP